MGEKNTLDLDIYKTFHTIAEYSFLSSANGTFLQDRPHISLNKFNSVEIIRRMFSDHSRIKLQINNKRKFRKFTNMSKLIMYLNNQLVKEKGIENKIRKYVEIIKTKALNTET